MGCLEIEQRSPNSEAKIHYSPQSIFWMGASKQELEVVILLLEKSCGQIKPEINKEEELLIR